MSVCLFSTLSHRVGALQISIIIIITKNMHTTSLALVYAILCESLILAKVHLLVTSMESSVLDTAVLLNKVSRPFGVIYEYNMPSSVLTHLVLVPF